MAEDQISDITGAPLPQDSYKNPEVYLPGFLRQSLWSLVQVAAPGMLRIRAKCSC